MLKAIIIDDEQLCREVLEEDIKKYCPDVHVLVSCASAKEGLKAIRSYNPDLVFLDIEMPWMNGFEMLEVLDKINFEVIFTTAYDQFAVKAFRISALDYLLKPIDHQDLKAAVKKVSQKKEGFFSKEHFDIFMQNLQPTSHTHRLALPNKNGFDYIEMDNIIYCEADGNYTTFFLSKRPKMVISRSIKEVEQMLNQPRFCRIHNSYLINIDHLKKYVRGDGGYVIMVNDTNLSVSRSKKEELLRKVNR